MEISVRQIGQKTKYKHQDHRQDSSRHSHKHKKGCDHAQKASDQPSVSRRFPPDKILCIRFVHRFFLLFFFPYVLCRSDKVCSSSLKEGEQTQGQIHKRRRGKLIQMVLPLRLLPSDHENQGYLITSFRPFRLPA